MAPNRVIPRACRYALPHSQATMLGTKKGDTTTYLAPAKQEDPHRQHGREPLFEGQADMASRMPSKPMSLPRSSMSILAFALTSSAPRDAPVAVGSSLRLTSRLNDDLESWMIRLYSITRLERGRSIITPFLSDTKLPHCCGYKHSSTLVKGKVGLVAAAGSPYGIGRSLVMALASAGPKAVYATDLTLANIQPLGKEVQGSGSTCSIHGAVLDMTSEEQTVQMIKQALAEYGRFDFFFAYAGVGLCKYESKSYLTRGGIVNSLDRTRPIMTGRLASCSGLSSWR
ncbi:hypothetical protein MAC_09196 [Metarhizium acridum CQMa 102]|uniref:Uncharacterized protein n=1 Tax=Metarhizium acridum (strain CQMa 102) TaxID=655827 RepID=E9EH48_METAQ|nr:uncharacterized protein MAC_09196 [Metarhizium acridum CQMa 102]EFY84752.1 hypothetical protein MAC_09196 [Metarhizium acridum CQMa 102]